MPTTPLDKLEVEMDTDVDEEEAEVIVIENVLLAVCEAVSVAVTVKL